MSLSSFLIVVVGSSIIFMVECQVRYMMGCLKHQLEGGLSSIACREDVMNDYLIDIDKLNLQFAWGSDVVSSWYKNSAGRVTQNWPGTHHEWWLRTRGPAAKDFVNTR